MTSTIGSDFGLPPEIQRMVEDGFLQIVTNRAARKTLEMHVASLRHRDLEGRITTVELTWIHPDYNAEFCEFFKTTPGDSPNFSLRINTTDIGDEGVVLDSLGDLLAWLNERRRLEI